MTARLLRAREADRCRLQETSPVGRCSMTAHHEADCNAAVPPPAEGKVAFVIVPAPGDRCGGSRLLEDGTRCPGCRACA